MDRAEERCRRTRPGCRPRLSSSASDPHPAWSREEARPAPVRPTLPAPSSAPSPRCAPVAACRGKNRQAARTPGPSRREDDRGSLPVARHDAGLAQPSRDGSEWSHESSSTTRSARHCPPGRRGGRTVAPRARVRPSRRSSAAAPHTTARRRVRRRDDRVIPRNPAAMRARSDRHGDIR